MKLTIGGKLIALPIDTEISIERSSPFLNNDTGSFSYPFPVPTVPNQKNLGWPGRLQRSGEIPDQTFILEDGGLQVLRGEVDYDDVTAKEIGIILKSGYTEFTKKMAGKKLADVDYGSESWPITDGAVVNITNIRAKLAEWDTANDTDNGKYVLSPFQISMAYSPGNIMYVNQQFWPNEGNATSYFQYPYVPGAYHGMAYCLQFRMQFVMQKIFESAGYTVLIDELSESMFNKAIFYSNILTIQIQTAGGVELASPVMGSLEYSILMPDIAVLDYLQLVKDLFCLMYEIDEFKKAVRIKFKKDVFLPENLDAMQIKELIGWTHKEVKVIKGFKLRYMNQDDELATHTDYPDFIDVVSTLPACTLVNKMVRIFSTGRDYITIENEDGDLEWAPVGRLREYTVGDGENVVELNVKVPVQKQFQVFYLTTEWNLECPSMPAIVRATNDSYTVISFLAITLYHGRKTFDGISFPYASFDRYSLDGAIDTEMSLKPSYLYDEVYSEFLNWQTYRARRFTKYIELSLVHLIALQWGKRYNIGGIEVILDIINYEFPYDGQVKIEGFTS